MKFESVNFPCSSCGAPTRYSPATGQLSCQFCNATSEIQSDTAQIVQHDLDQAMLHLEQSTPKEIAKDVRCQKCGSGFSFTPHTASTICPHCGTPTITEFVNSITPESILPFEVTHKKAKEIFADWIGSLWFAPSELKHLVDSDKRLTGHYMPYWCYDADTNTSYHGERGDIYYVTVQRREMVDGKEQTVEVQEQRISWSNVSGIVGRQFDDLTIYASSAISPKIQNALAPWDTSKLKSFDQKYLAGFESTEYTIGVDDGFDMAKNIMSSIIEGDIRQDIGGDEQNIDSMQINYMDKKFKNSLFPIWTTHFMYKGKDYIYAINGQSGEVTGERPYSYTKIAILVGTIILAVAAGVYYYQSNVSSSIDIANEQFYR